MEAVCALCSCAIKFVKFGRQKKTEFGWFSGFI